jgi:hypothetical protein
LQLFRIEDGVKERRKQASRRCGCPTHGLF